MPYAAAPAAGPDAGAVPAIEEGKAAPTIDSHGGKLSVYMEPTGSILVLGAILSVLAPRRLRAFGGVDLGWTRLVPGLLVSAVLAWNLRPSPLPFSNPGFEHYLWVTAVLMGGMFAFAFLNLLADALFPTDRPSASRSVLAMCVSALGLAIVLGLSTVDWWGMGPYPTISVNPMPPLISLAGLPLGLGLLVLWRRFNGWTFELGVALGTLGSLFLAGYVADKLLPDDEGAPVVSIILVALTVAATAGFGLRGIGRQGWQDLTGRAIWAWAWVLRAVLIANTVFVTAF